MATPFQQIITSNQDLNRVQANITNAFNNVDGPFIGGSLLQSVNVGTSATTITHGLGRQPQVWVLCDKNANANIWRTSWNTNTITLEASAACTVSLWVN